MTETEKKALAQAVAAAGRRMQDYAIMAEENVLRQSIEAHARAIEQHEAFRQEVSDAVEGFYRNNPYEISCYCDDLKRFIIAKPDPLVEALGSLGLEKADEWAPDIRKALAARGGRIVWEGE